MYLFITDDSFVNYIKVLYGFAILFGDLHKTHDTTCIHVGGSVNTHERHVQLGLLVQIIHYALYVFKREFTEDADNIGRKESPYVLSF